MSILNLQLYRLKNCHAILFIPFQTVICNLLDTGLLKIRAPLISVWSRWKERGIISWR